MDSSVPHYDNIKPPVITVGVLGWIRKNLFNTVWNSALTIITVYALARIIPPFVRWAFVRSVWFGADVNCNEVAGACWPVITQNIRFIIFGFYPPAQQWRPIVAMLLLIVLIVSSQDRSRWNKWMGYTWLAAIVVMGILMRGGLFGLQLVESTQWGGLPLTLLLSVFGLTAAYPLGVVLALGRRSNLPVVKTLSVIYIELIRGVPLISLLFMSSVVFPLFLPEGVNVNKIVRALAAIILFTAAYIAEVVRGGLQAIPNGQYEAAQSIGLNYFQTMRLVILPQALKIVIPPSVSILISAFKDTSLVVIIALFDLLRTTQTVLTTPKWMGASTEAYIFVAAIYFVCCFFMSNYSRRLERELHTGL